MRIILTRLQLGKKESEILKNINSNNIIDLILLLFITDLFLLLGKKVLVLG